MKTRPRKAWPVLALVALVIGFKPAAARAAVRVEFYSHPSGLTPKLYYYSPHAFIAVKPEGESAVLKAPDTFGYETRDAYGAVIGGHAKGEVAKADPHFLPISKLHFWVVISDEQYLALTRGIAAWDSFPGHPYSLKTRNCLTFEAEMARLVGLVAPPPASLDPSRYLEDIKAANRDRVEIPGEQRAGGPRIAGSGAQ